MVTPNKVEVERTFDDFLMAMDDQLDALRKEALTKSIILDFTPDDFERLEDLFNLTADGADKDTVASLIVTFARYLGELVRVNFGGQWHLSLEDQKNVNFNTPVIFGHCQVKGVEFAPLSVMRAFALRRKAGTLRRAVDAQVNINPLDLSDLSEE